jgi:hypothetical protein
MPASAVAKPVMVLSAPTSFHGVDSHSGMKQSAAAGQGRGERRNVAITASLDVHRSQNDLDRFAAQPGYTQQIEQTLPIQRVGIAGKVIAQLIGQRGHIGIFCGVDTRLNGLAYQGFIRRAAAAAEADCNKANHQGQARAEACCHRQISLRHALPLYAGVCSNARSARRSSVTIVIKISFEGAKDHT